MKADGTEQTRITTGALDLGPVAAPDGFIYYNTPSAGAPRTFKVPIEGGSPVSLGDHYFRPTDISKDGTQLLGVGWYTQERRSSLAIMPVAGGPPTWCVRSGPSSADGDRMAGASPIRCPTRQHATLEL